jgi:hypothetical protein
MTAVVLSRKLALDLTNLRDSTYAFNFASEFQLWKDGGIGPGDTFGKNTPFIKPADVVRCDLWKVHLEVDDVSVHWNRKLTAGELDPNRFTSDSALVYSRLGDMTYQPYLLLSILDPAHPFMENPSKVQALAAMFEQERSAFARREVEDPWVVVGMP